MAVTAERVGQLLRKAVALSRAKSYPVEIEPDDIGATEEEAEILQAVINRYMAKEWPNVWAVPQQGDMPVH